MIVVFGTLNVDVVMPMPRLPAPGEGVKGDAHVLLPGGKGGNQALAAARAGARVTMVGAVGRDAFAEIALADLAAEGIDLGAVVRSDRPTGLQAIAVDPSGETIMIGSNGANGDAAAALPALAARLSDEAMLLIQTSVGTAAAAAAVEAARSAGARVVLTATVPPEGTLLDAVDLLLVNRPEASALARAAALPDEPAAFARALAARHATTVVVTLGAQGLVAATPDGTILTAPPPPTTIVDTTGAGDALAGAVAAALDRGADLATALAEGVAAGALACHEVGARSSFATADEIRATAARIVVDTVPGGRP